MNPTAATVSVPNEVANASENNANGPKKRPYHGSPAHKRQKDHKRKKVKPVKEGSNEEVLLTEVRELLAKQKLSDTANELDSKSEEQSEPTPLPERFSEIEVKVAELSSTGDGLAFASGSSQIYVVPFTAPGDVVKIKVIAHKGNHTICDFLSVVEPSSLRDDSRINCKYFASCSGCQFQMLDYKTQLAHKKTIVEKAYKYFSQLPPELIPVIEDTMGSPLQYGYRTKLTPHFDGPPGHRSKIMRREGKKATFDSVPPIGFMLKGQRTTLDIEDCPIGTDAVRMGMKRERKRVGEELDKYNNGATILLRESTQRIAKGEPLPVVELREGTDYVKSETPEHTDIKSCITDNNATSTEFIDTFKFTNPAGSFFQNNNSILKPFTQYIREHVLPLSTSDKKPEIKYLIDAYSGSGLFTITLSSLFESSTGIDISGPSIEFARQNAKLNDLSETRCSFMAADAPELFKSVKFPADQTVVVIDPPRKGCDESFLNQLLKFGPRRVVYVSCNVHTQARDVGVLVRGGNGAKYDIESLRGFDFFPQTGHVEGVAVLNRVDEAEEAKGVDVEEAAKTE